MASFPILDACTLFGPWPRHADELTLDNLVGAMGQNNIARSMALSTTGIFHDFRAGNAATLEAARAHPSQLFPVATLDPRAYPDSLREAEARAGEGFRLFRFYPNRQGWPIRFAPFRELLQKCDSLGVIVAVQIDQPGEITELADAVTFTQAPLLLAGVSPNTLGEAIAIMRGAPKFHLETTHLIAPGALEAVAQNVENGADRLIFASHSPLRYLSAGLGPVLASGLSNDQKAAVLGGNLKRLISK